MKRLNTKLKRQLPKRSRSSWKLTKLWLNVKAKAGSDSRLFGSISSKKIIEGLDKQFGIKLDKHKLELREPIKVLGYTNVPVKLFKGVESKVRVHVTQEN